MGTTRRFWAAALAVLAIGATSITACERKGPAERAGDKIDKAGEKIRDTVDPPSGPGEKVGRKIDRAVDHD